MAPVFTRRSILKSIVVMTAASSGGLLTACGGGGDDGKPGGPAPTPGEQFFPLSVASGDPRDVSLVLWTRIVDGEGDKRLGLQVATDAEFRTVIVEQGALPARAEHDGCLKVKVIGLQPRTTYFYRFLYEKDGTLYTSRTGRSRTAPAANDDVPVRFAIANCQDFTGRYYNTHQRLLQLDAELDFVLFVGDYVYETTGDPRFQDGASHRKVVFSEPASAIALGTESARYYAASSVSNYRDLYKTYRSDKQLQALHERYPAIVIWDDHEFADDSHGATSTHFAGRRDETDPERRRNAEQAFFEYLPVDPQGATEGVIETARESLYPNTRLWRGFDFGRNFRLLVTDYRSFRPDHLIPEDGFPGTVVLDQDVLTAAAPQILAQLPEAQFAYVNISSDEFSRERAALLPVVTGLYLQNGLGAPEAAAKAADVVKGNLALQVVNQLLAAAKQEPIAVEGRSRGVAFVHFAKLTVFSSVGARYFAAKNFYDLYADILYNSPAGGPASQDALGTEQQAWLYDSLVQPEATWCGVVSSVSLTSMPLNLSTKEDLDPLLRQDFYFSVDQWDGFPNKRGELVHVITEKRVHNTLCLSGDIHGAFVSGLGGQPSNVALTAPAMSSSPMRELVRNAVANTGLPTGEGTPFYGYVVDELETTLQQSNPSIRFVRSDRHGFVLVEADGKRAKAEFHLVPHAEVRTDYSSRAEALAGKFEVHAFEFPSTRTSS